jgi:phage-related protein
MYQVYFYKTARGDSPVEEFLGEMDKHTRAKTAQFIDLLRELGLQLRRPFADKLQGKIYELRPKQARILYFFFVGHEIILAHGFLKKTNAVDKSDIELAERRRVDWIARHHKAKA